MNKRSLDLLGQVYQQEIDAALHGAIRVWLPPRLNKLAEALADTGYLERATVTLRGLPPIEVKGYVLTHAGYLAYCSSGRCKGDPDAEVAA